MGNIIKDNDLISARQARECARAYRKSVINNEIKKVQEAITDAMNKGKTNAYIDGSISIDTKHIFENLGYKVRYGSQYNESYVVVDWSGEI